MKLGVISILLTSLILISPSSIFAQSTTDAAEKADNLRLQLLDVQTKEAELQERVRQLDEAAKPENIEQSLAGVGSTHPEELREQRRRQLQIEKDSLVAQLGHLSKTRASLEAAIATADADAYHQSARGTGPATLDRMLLTQFSQLPKWMTLLILTLLPTLVIAGLVLVIRRLQASRGSRAS
jgi:hypothetical protein